MRREAIKRIRIISIIVVCLMSVLVVRLYVLQVMRGDTYREMGEGQYVHTVHDLYKRGSIYFTTKDGEHVSGATIKTGYLLAIDPTKILDIEEAYTKISAIIPLDKENFTARANRKDKTYQEIEQEVANEDADAIKALTLSGVKLYRNQWRYYPGKSLAARTVGFVGYNDSTLEGKYGIERYYEDILRRDDEHLSVNFFAEIFSNLGDLIFDASDSTEGDVVTTIEPTVARTLDRVLIETQEKWSSEVTGGIIINPKNGEVIALNVIPSFDLNDRSGVKIEDFRNPLVENVYELGSIIKPLTIAAGIDAGVINADSTYSDTGKITLDEYTIHNHDKKAHGTTNMQQVLSQSLNIGVAHVAMLLGKERFRNYFRNLKLGTESGIDLPNEGRGLMKVFFESPRQVEYVTASFGQGIALTPIGAVRALSTIANGGTLVTPHIVKSIAYKNGEKKDMRYPDGERVFKAETTEDVTRMLVNIVDNALKNGKVKNEYYSVAAKTGTAQISDQVNGGYYDDRYLHSFFGYFPAYDPQFLIFLYTVYPKEVQFASETLTDPFIELEKFLINYYGLPPDR